ncbi:cell division protein FtsQ [Ureibacillus xyleni]|uniref:Cell division protein DivIB n=1 Tax=Ureibacillus xyleni TaxID=614648 RepID=A0A285RJ33_9BACL|nr:FtsQ-type POTRA domain-containing protein [Ureibacillus xyleni]SOB92422.1 cell division protein FtsQ [Ureibacillus xyleni]
MDKVIDIEDRIPTLREKRRKRTNIKFIVLIILFFLTLFLLLYFQSPYSEIKKIQISGSNLVEDSEYLKQSDLQIGDSMWGFHVGEIEKKIQQQYWVKSVKVKRKWLTTVEIKVDEWQKVAYISEDNAFFPMLENGDVFRESNTLEPIDAPLFLQFDDEKLRKRLLKELAKLEPTVLALISQINATPTSADPYAITLFMNDGYEVRAEITTLAEKLNYYPSIVAQIEHASGYSKGIIDIEVGSYYKSFDDEYTQLDINLEEMDVQEQEVLGDEETTLQ